MVKSRGLNARADVSTTTIFYFIIMVIVLVLVLYFTVPSFQKLVYIFHHKQQPFWNDEAIQTAKTYCGNVLSNCCGDTDCDFSTALHLAKNQKMPLCLGSIANVCETLHITGCSPSKLRAGNYSEGMNDNASIVFEDYCDQLYRNKIKCEHVVKEDTSVCTDSDKYKVLHKCVDVNGIEHDKGTCISEADVSTSNTNQQG